jgi:N-acetylglutamate synthase-like GNAT family acetyltransferase
MKILRSFGTFFGIMDVIKRIKKRIIMDDPDIAKEDFDTKEDIDTINTAVADTLAAQGQTTEKRMTDAPAIGAYSVGDTGLACAAIVTRIAIASDVKCTYTILEEMEKSARIRGTGIARRTPQSICQKIYDGKAVIAVTDNGEWVGFSYIETWSEGKFVSNSGLIVNPAYRKSGVATAIKQEIFGLSRRLYPEAVVFSITTGAAVMKLNHKFGFQPVTYSEITRDEKFWDQCRHCVNHSILESKERKICLCTAMAYFPAKN